ncbi:Bidirectional sugar transporter SWEET2a-like protein [Drosera capensis]
MDSAGFSAFSSSLGSVYSICCDAAGVAGTDSLNPLVDSLFLGQHLGGLSEINQQSSSSLLNCLICLWYGIPIITPGGHIGCYSQLYWHGIPVNLHYHLHQLCGEGQQISEYVIQVKMSALLLGVFVAFGIIMITSLTISDPHVRRMSVGFLSAALLISMFASPLFIIVSCFRCYTQYFQ